MSELDWFKTRVYEFLPDLPVSDEQYSALHKHFELLCRWNERMDLTSVDTLDEIVSRHYCESLFFAANVPDDRDELSIVDFGSGAGFPGYPMAVLRPKWQITLLEANQRRAVFLKEAARDLPNVTVRSERGEAFSEKHDWVVARAVKATDVLGCVPRLAPRVGLLVGEASVPELRKMHECVWSKLIHIPWSQARCCAFSRCST